MKFIVDFANLDQIKEVYAYYTVDGVTTNPSILAKERKNPYEVLKAIKALAKEGANITATAIYTQMQAYLAGKAGAHYAAPYVNRIDNLGADGVKVAKEIHDIFKKNGLKTEVLAASFKNSQQV
jgi:transaldolase